MITTADLGGSRIAFYATVATVLPIVMIALGFQFRARDVLLGRVSRVPRWGRPLVHLGALIIVVVMGSAEFAAIFELAYARNDAYTLVRWGAFVGGFVLLIGTANAVATQLQSGFEAEDRRAAVSARETSDDGESN